jgi:hypothetical protein
MVEGVWRVENELAIDLGWSQGVLKTFWCFGEDIQVGIQVGVRISDDSKDKCERL